MTVKNNSGQPFSAVFVHVYYYDGNNNMLDSSGGEIDNLAGDGIASVDCFGSSLKLVKSYKAVVFKKFRDYSK